MLAQLRPAYESGAAQFRSAYASAGVAITVIHDTDGSNVDPGSVVVTDATSEVPTVYCDIRAALASEGWRIFLFAVENAEGKRPIFRFNRATRRERLNFAASWRPMWTQDFVTWTQAPSFTTTGTTSSGYVEWQFADPLPAGRVYITSHPVGRQAESTAFAAHLLSNHSSVASPAPSADVDGVYATSPAETDDLGRQIGEHPMHAIKLAWGSATTDGARKRKLVVLANIHSAGEACSWVSFRAFIDWVMLDASTEAQAVRANWDLYLYFSLTPNGLYAGTHRWNVQRTSDPNRVWKTDHAAITLQEIKDTANAVYADVGGQADALFSWHGWNSSDDALNLFFDPEDYNSGTRTPAAASMLSALRTRFGMTGNISTSSTSNTDCWWGKAKLGAKVSVDSEVPHNTTNSAAFYADIGVKWGQSLYDVDAQGIFVQPAAELAAASLIATTATGSLTTGIALHGAASSMTLADGALTIGIRLRGDALSQAVAAAGLSTAIQLAAAAQAGAQATGELTVPGAPASLEGHAQAAALAAGSITTIIRLDAAAVAKVVGAGTLTAPGAPSQLEADATVLAIASGGLTTAIALRGAAASVVQASGTLDIALTFEAQAFVQAMASGVLSTQVRLDGAAVASALARVDLTGGMPVVPPVERTIPVRAEMRVIPVRAQTRLIPA